MAVLSVIMGFFLMSILEDNLDEFLHQQADNFKATMTIRGTQFTFHDLNPDFEHNRPNEQEIPFHVQVLDLNYKTLMLSGNLHGKSLYRGGELPHYEIHETVREGGDKVRRMVTPLTVSNHHVGWIIVTVSYHYLDKFRNRLYIIVALATLAAINLLTLASYFFVQWSLKPVLNLASRVNEQTSEDDFTELPIPEGEDEFAYLTETFNGLLFRAKSSLESLERFSADASHELKTPLAIMKSELVRLESRQDDMDTATLHGEISRMQLMIENLLILSQTDVPYHVKLEDLWINDFIADETSRIQQVSTHKHIRFDMQAVGSIKVQVDSYLLYLIFNNLLRNAIRYSPRNSTIWLSSQKHEVDGIVVIEIRDEGPGIPEEDLKLIFDRFYRLDSSRSRYRGGSGLGLSIAKWAAEKMNAAVSLDNHEESGLLATIVLRG